MGKMSAVPVWFKAAAIALFAVTFTLDMAISAVSNSSYGKESGFFPNTTGEVSNKYMTIITPSNGTFAIWGFIYTYTLVAIGYALSTICRKGSEGKGIYDNPEVIPSSYYITFSVHLSLTAIWLVVWSHQMLCVASGLIVASVALLVLCLVQSCHQLDNAGSAMVRQGVGNDIWYVHAFVQNMTAVFLAWLSVAGTISVVTVAVYAKGWCTMNQAGICAVVFLFCVVTFWFGLETFFLDRYLRYIALQYPVYITALSGIITRGFDPNSLVSVAVAATLGWVCVLFLAKIAVITYRTIKHPIVYIKSADDAAPLPVKEKLSDYSDADDQ